MYSNQKKSRVKGVIKKTGVNIPYAVEALNESKWNRNDAIDYINDGKKKPTKKKKYHAKG